ncbi:MAG TPA: transglycosylase SLT domain-containing protein [Anaerolineales bacterium]|nr:transglycosylase SLT domain-containing protein [Anaerolineales bacterium]
MSRRPMRIAIQVMTSLLAAVACALPSSLPFVATPTPTITLTPTPTSSPTPTPTPLPAPHFEAAERALTNGDWEQALADYLSALVLSGSPADQAEAQLGVGHARLRAGRLGEAVEALTLFAQLFPSDDRLAEAYLLRAQAHLALGENDLAIADNDAYLALRPDIIAGYVNEQVGDLLTSAARYSEAIDRYRAAIASPGVEGTLTLEIKIGRAYLDGDEPARALEQFDLIYQAYSEDGVRAAMNRLAGLALEAMGDFDAAHARYLANLASFPDEYEAYLGLIRLVEARVPVDDYLRGYIDYQAGAYEPALNALDRAADASPSAAVFYYRGLSRRALGDHYGAIADFEHLISTFPYDPLWTDAWFQRALTERAYIDQPLDAVDTYLDFVDAAPLSPSAPDALFSAGRTAERLTDLLRAAEIWMRIPNEYPASELADRGAFQAGIVRYRLGEIAAAGEAFALAETLANEPSERAAAFLWIGKARLAQGDAGGAQESWQAAAGADPTGYYSARAQDLLAGLAPFTTVVSPNLAPDLAAERLQAEAWLRSTLGVAGPDPLTDLSPALAADPRMNRALEFWHVGLYAEAEAELDSLRRAVENDPEATYRLMHTLLELRFYNPAIFAARQILRLAGMGDAATLDAPIYFNRIRFGVYFDDLLLPEADRYGLDPLLLLSVVRQESLFDGFAISSASARGLMQVVPATGEMIAGQLGWPPAYTEADLYRPIVSLRFGAFYLASQRDAFGGDLYAALAAYNAGPGNSLAWRDLAPDDPDLFLEVIRITETHLYITRVYEFYAIYRRLYATP